MQPIKNQSIIPNDTNNATCANPSNYPTTAQQSGYKTSNIDSTGSKEVHGISNGNYLPSPFSNSFNKVLPQMQDEHSIPALINLKTSGLRRSPRLAALQNNNDAPEIAAYTSSTTPSFSRLFSKPRPRLSYFLVFNLVGSLWTFATTTSHAYHETYSFAA